MTVHVEYSHIRWLEEVFGSRFSDTRLEHRDRASPRSRLSWLVRIPSGEMLRIGVRKGRRDKEASALQDAFRPLEPSESLLCIQRLSVAPVRSSGFFPDS